MSSACPQYLPTPRILYLPEGGLVLCDRQEEQITLSHMHSGESIMLSGVFAERLMRYIEAPQTQAFPNLGPLARRHAWLQQLQPQAPAVSDLLLGTGLGMLFIELTDRCNESCVHCYAESSPQRSNRLSREEIERILVEARDLGHPAVQFTGGDPLLHPDLVFGVQKARALDYASVEIYTNGLALNKSLLAELLPYRPSFAFSIYASDADVHDAITQVPGSLARTLKAMHRVQQAGLPLRVGIVLMQQNRGTADATMAFLQQELGLDIAQMGTDVVRSTGRGEFVHDAAPETPNMRKFRHRADSPPDTGPPARQQAGKIPARSGKLCVSSTGDVFPCIFSRRTSLGSIRRQSLGGIFTALDKRSLSAPSGEHWNQCRERLSCSDCQVIAYLLEDASQIIPIAREDAHAAA